MNRSIVKDIDALHQMIQDFDSGYLILWLYHNLVLAKVEDGQAKYAFDPPITLADIVRFRLFNEQEEYHGWRSGEQLYYRYRRDQLPFSAPKPITTKMVIVGKLADQLKYLDKEKADAEELRIEMRNYVGYSEIGQAGYVDCRFVKFTD